MMRLTTLFKIVDLKVGYLADNALQLFAFVQDFSERANAGTLGICVSLLERKLAIRDRAPMLASLANSPTERQQSQ